MKPASLNASTATSPAAFPIGSTAVFSQEGSIPAVVRIVR